MTVLLCQWTCGDRNRYAANALIADGHPARRHHVSSVRCCSALLTGTLRDDIMSAAFVQYIHEATTVSCVVFSPCLVTLAACFEVAAAAATSATAVDIN
eukprot:303980-Chlamydomonas_euryale.AAC.13